MKPWSAKHIALLVGLTFFCVGLVLIYQVLGAGGVIDLQATLGSGKIDRGSAGFIIIFLATTMVISSLAFGNVDEHGQQKRISSFLWGMTLFVLTISLLVLVAAKSFEGWGIFAVFISALFVVLFVTIAATQFLQDQ